MISDKPAPVSTGQLRKSEILISVAMLVLSFTSIVNLYRFAAGVLFVPVSVAL